ncbi:helix-turn-helix transcriptional regulator [Pseudonocardia sp. GCM10023141]|uniref:helix-turn-helix transcriptional regulator n=1 Tax=Pseudonocardia sp. GCM10023141 TaxID=3252653 RepID=UPI003613A92A
MSAGSAQIAEALRRLHRGTPSVLVVHLDPATRASGVFAELRTAASGAGYRTVTVGAVESDQLSARPRLLDALTGSEHPVGDGGAIANRVAELLDAAAQSAPVVVIVEDAGWTDPGTLLALRTVPEQLGHLPIGWVIGLAAGDARADRAIAPLERLGALTVPADTPERPATGSDRVALLQVGAVIGAEFDPQLAAQVLGRPVGSILGEIDSALAEGVLVDRGAALRFADLRYRDRLYVALPSSVRRALHHEIARCRLAWPGEEVKAVWHLSRSTGRLSTADLAVVRGAIGRLAAVSPEDAAELAFRISGLYPSPDPHHVEFVITGATHLGRTSRAGEALSMLERLAVSGLTTREEARLRLVSAHLHQAAGDDIAAMEHVTRALALPAVDGHVQLALLKIRSAGHVNLGEVDAAEHVSRPILSAARSSPDPATRVSADLFASQLAFGRAEVTTALHLAEQAASGVEVSATRPLHAPRIPELWLATVLLSSDRFDEASELLLDGQRHYERRGLGWSAPYWHTVRAIERWMRHELDDAAAEAETALDAATRLDMVRPRQLTQAVLAIIEAERGRDAAARRVLDGRTLPRRPGTYDIWTAAAQVRLAPDGADEARRWLDRHANVARMMSLAPTVWPSLVDPDRSRGRVRGALTEIARAARDQHAVVTAATGSTHPRIAATGTAQRPASGWGSLTASELRVAALVADGHTNRAIAEQLHVSIHTVGTHLRHAFTKLDINTRVELTRMALTHGRRPG